MLVTLLWFFLIYAVMGWCLEVLFAALKTHQFVNRGFLNGPYCPIYGVGVTMIVTLLESVKNNLFLVFIGSVLILSLIELITGYLLERLFRQKWWDYSDRKYNLGGYICLKFSLFWGAAILLVVRYVHPWIAEIVENKLIPQGLSLLLVGLVIVTIDLIITTTSILKVNHWISMSDFVLSKVSEISENIKTLSESSAIRLTQTKDELSSRIDIVLDFIKEDYSKFKETQQNVWLEERQSLFEIEKTISELLEAVPFGLKRLYKAFPKLSNRFHLNEIERLKQLKSDLKLKSKEDDHES